MSDGLKTFGYVIPANAAVSPYSCYLEDLQAKFPPPETNSLQLAKRRWRQHAETDWGCTFTTHICLWRHGLGGQEFKLVVDDFGKDDVQLPFNNRATCICELRDRSGGYPVRGDAFLCAAAEPWKMDGSTIEQLIDWGRARMKK